jgi:hypothetical protein
MDSITAKQWREMSTPDIIASMDTAIEVLRKRNIDEEWMSLLLDIAKRILEIAIGED